MTSESNMDTLMDSIEQYIDEMQPSINVLYKESKEHSTPDWDILQEVLETVKKTAHFERGSTLDTTTKGQLKKFNEKMLYSIAEELFLEARETNGY